MKRNSVHRILQAVPWTALALGISLILCLSLIPANAPVPWVVLWGYVCGILPMLGVAITWLMLAHRQIFTSWLGWLIPTALLLISRLPIEQPIIALLLITVTILSMWAIGVATVILLWYRDFGLQLFGRTLVLCVWGVVLAWRFQGDLVELWLQNLNNPAGSPLLWWLSPLVCVVWWVIPLSLLSIAGHTIRLIWRELRYP